MSPGVAGWGQRGTPVSEHLKVLRLCCLRVAGGTQALVSPASQAAADARGRAERPQSAAASRIIGISLQEAQQILNVSNLNPEEIQKVEASLEPGRDGAGRAWPLQGRCCAWGWQLVPRLGPVNPSLRIPCPSWSSSPGLASASAQQGCSGKGCGISGGAHLGTGDSQGVSGRAICVPRVTLQQCSGDWEAARVWEWEWWEWQRWGRL